MTCAFVLMCYNGTECARKQLCISVRCWSMYVSNVFANLATVTFSSVAL